jgi:phthalate 4,5-cis-dihydrodiol dehydrogenase
MPDGVMIYTDEKRWLDALPAPKFPRAEVIDELAEAVLHGRAPLHSGAWGLATIEVCLAILQSARERKEIALTPQVGIAQRS